MRHARAPVIDLTEVEKGVWDTKDGKNQPQGESVDIFGLKLIPWIILYYALFRLLSAYMGWEALPACLP
jgi:hypothetical protein